MRHAVLGAVALAALGLHGCGTSEHALTSCPAGAAPCGEICVDTRADEANCGGCGLACPDGQLCRSGQCAAVCPAGYLLCGGGCVDPLTSRTHCGASGDCAANPGVDCATGEVCGNGVCAVSCPAGQLDCGGRCIDPLTDRTFCGATNDCTGADVGVTCAAGQVCATGACAVSCPAGQLDCGGRCIDPFTDRTFCGATDDCTGSDVGVTCSSSPTITVCLPR